ncbi:MAG: hypothetical protein QOJ34_1498 [Pseudonocardiales bacterium]|jgi:hypothetical protein|nr:hypothetical protein [Pseudonocardiales bacterium]
MRPASPCRGGRRASSLHCRCGLVAPDRNSPSKQRPLGRSSTTLVTTAIAPPALTRTPERLLSPDSTSRARSRWWPPIGVRREGRARGADRPHVVLRARRRVPERRPSARPPARTPRRAARSSRLLRRRSAAEVEATVARADCSAAVADRPDASAAVIVASADRSAASAAGKTLASMTASKTAKRAAASDLSQRRG